MLWWKYQQLRMGNAKSRLAVIEQLAISTDEGAVGPLIFALQDKDAAARTAAARALSRFQDRRAVDPLLKMLHDPVVEVRSAAAETLGHLGDPVAVNHLVGFLRDTDPSVRAIAARSLEKLGWKPGNDSHRVLQILAMGNLQQLVAMGRDGIGPLLDLLRHGPPNRPLFRPRDRHFVSVAAVALGACCIERHITLDRAMWGSDQAASLAPNGINRLVHDIRLIEQSMGDGVKRVYERELPIIKKLRRVGAAV